MTAGRVIVGSFHNLHCSPASRDPFVAAGLPGTGLSYIDHLFHRRRAMWATMVALAWGVIGVVAVLVAVLTGNKFDDASFQVDPALAELYDFAALQGAGMRSATAQAGFVPESANTGTATPPLASQPNKRCTRATWPFFDTDCLWANTADTGTHARPRRRIVARLKSPWCSGLHAGDGAYFCRSRS
jgi:hypothetical protein